MRWVMRLAVVRRRSMVRRATRRTAMWRVWVVVILLEINDIVVE
jgi:hypothetical protein